MKASRDQSHAVSGGAGTPAPPITDAAPISTLERMAIAHYEAVEAGPSGFTWDEVPVQFREDYIAAMRAALEPMKGVLARRMCRLENGEDYSPDSVLMTGRRGEPVLRAWEPYADIIDALLSEPDDGASTGVQR